MLAADWLKTFKRTAVFFITLTTGIATIILFIYIFSQNHNNHTFYLPVQGRFTPILPFIHMYSQESLQSYLYYYYFLPVLQEITTIIFFIYIFRLESQQSSLLFICITRNHYNHTFYLHVFPRITTVIPFYMYSQESLLFYLFFFLPVQQRFTAILPFIYVYRNHFNHTFYLPV